MALSMHRVSTGSFEQAIPALAASLRKGEGYALSRNIAPASLLAMKLYPDMYSLAEQVWAAARQAMWTSSVLCGEVPGDPGPVGDSFAMLYSCLDQALEHVRSYGVEDIEATQASEVALALPKGELRMPAEDYLLKFALPNFYFHTTAAYAILRQCGVELNKGDFLGPLT
jgi:uncharacterized protein